MSIDMKIRMNQIKSELYWIKKELKSVDRGSELELLYINQVRILEELLVNVREMIKLV